VALTKYNFNSFDVTSAASKALGFNASANGLTTISPGSMTLIKTVTASSDSTVTFVNGTSDVVLDSTYPIYLFKIVNAHPANDDITFKFQADTGTNTNYNQTINSTHFRSQHTESGSSSSLSYLTASDQAQGTSDETLANSIGNDNDQSVSGMLHIFNPSSTTFVKHFISNFQSIAHSDTSNNEYHAGYFNTTTAITRVRFKFSSGNIDSGTFKLYGIKDS
jgi:hypothetical protein